MDMEKVISRFEKIISICKEDGGDFVDLSFEDAEQILAILKEMEEERLEWIGAVAKLTAENELLKAEASQRIGHLGDS